jgi:thymidylate synthase ThyX
MFDTRENFTQAEKNALKPFVSTTESNVFALKNLSEVIKGALFSRYSRSYLGLRTLLLKDFLKEEESLFHEISSCESQNKQENAIKKAQTFYDRILDGYGDDSIGELGGAHLALEHISMLAAKFIQDGRIGGSPLEKSTRYIYFDKKVNGKYPYYRDSKILKSPHATLYENTCDQLFETYSNLSKPLTSYIEKQFPQKDIPDGAYKAALRAKVLDCLRGILPAATLTNMGVFGNGRFFEKLVRVLHQNPLHEMKDLGGKTEHELSKIIPSFIRRAHPSHPNYQSFATYKNKLDLFSKKLSTQIPSQIKATQATVNLCHWDEDGPKKVAQALLFSETQSSMNEQIDFMNQIDSKQWTQWFQELGEIRDSRRHKAPRAAEHAFFTFEIIADFGIYRDLQRHRMLTQEKQMLTCSLGYTVPEEITACNLDKEYIKALSQAKNTYDEIAKTMPIEAQYVVPMAYHIRWYFKANLRSLQWLCELRSAAAGHAQYRYIAQEMARKVCDTFPCFTPFFKFVDFEGHPLGRLQQETRRIHKQNKTKKL